MFGASVLTRIKATGTSDDSVQAQSEWPLTHRSCVKSSQCATARRRVSAVRAVLIVSIALMMSALAPWNHGQAANAAAIAVSQSTIDIPADRGDDHHAGIPNADHCVVHAGCALSPLSEASGLPVSSPSKWPPFDASGDLGRRPGPDPRPPRSLS